MIIVQSFDPLKVRDLDEKLGFDLFLKSEVRLKYVLLDLLLGERIVFSGCCPGCKLSDLRVVHGTLYTFPNRPKSSSGKVLIPATMRMAINFLERLLLSIN